MKDFAKVFPWLVVGAAGLFLIFSMIPLGTGPGGMDLADFGSIPIVDRGRVKPLDTYARTTLMVISNRQTYRDENGKSQPAIKWVLDVMTRTDKGISQKVFRIENDQVLSMLGLKPREGLRYSIEEFLDKIDLIRDKAIAAQKVKPDRRDLFQDKIVELAKHLEMYSELARRESPLMVPPQDKGEQWQSLVQSVIEYERTRQENPATLSLAMMLQAYKKGDPRGFNEALADYRKQTEKAFPNETKHADFEVFFNHFAPFYQCTLLYVAVFLLAFLGFLLMCLSAKRWSEPLYQAAFWLAILTLVVHTGALLARMYLMGRSFVFVTNLYSSAVFIGWAGVALCLVLERVFRIGIATVVASVVGGATMLIAHHLGSSGDTLEMMQAVLDTNFWLATHVTCVTLGYAATFVAGLIGVVYIGLGVLTSVLDRSLSKVLGQMLYAVVCFATLLSFTGTVLGGIWADQSWGRFWGWDPKENGALLIVIWNALILHARWGGMVKQRGMAVLAIFGNMVTGWSWFGTNQLQVGLHSYGFSNTLAVGLVIGWALHAAVLVLGLLPLRWWGSHDLLLSGKLPPVEEPALPPEKPAGKRRGKRGTKQGDPGIFAGPA
jgi:ABC-type transport system involved in cytochrome c biogenesis permease subunit